MAQQPNFEQSDVQRQSAQQPGLQQATTQQSDVQLPDGDKLFKLVVEGPESTVVAEYEPDRERVSSYQSEAELEEELLRILESQGYERPSIHSEDDFKNNLRTQLEALNNIQFSEDEWDRFFHEVIAPPNASIEDKTRLIQEDNIQVLRRDDGTQKNIRLIDKVHVHSNRLQVLHQFEEESGNHPTRYDVTILVNGLPLVQIELKRRGVAIKEAFNQINRYQRDSFWAGSGLYEYAQIFIISNGTHTKYYSNTTRFKHIRESEGRRTDGRSQKTSDSFEFTSWWADGRNRVIADLTGFAKTFLARHALLNILTRYCVFTSEHDLLVMRPYQIAATERVLNRILISEYDKKKLGKPEAGGYIWHTTGSGKTLTSFKTAQLASGMEGVDKVLFVVDRKDLDYQTIKEYERFKKGAVNSNKSTKVLAAQLADPKATIIVTTIQKLASFIRSNPKHDVYAKHVALIFDECHRSQFGEMHTAITKHFKNYHLFGFTGTPIFAMNAKSGGSPNLRTTGQAFGDCLHSYTVVDAIKDGNVLPFRIGYVDTVRRKEGIQDKQVYGINAVKALSDPRRVSTVVSYVLEHFDQKTKRQSGYMLKKRRLHGFNSLFAADSIDMAKQYYSEFQRQQDARGGEVLKIALIYSFAPNEADPGEQGFIDDEDFETSGLDQSSRDFLDAAIQDYNRMFATSFSTASDQFENYYKDLSERLKNRDLDMVIVVNMLLTGFDATTLNTLWVDKGLKQHGLMQAFSRTNRILNSVKTFGNVICFRDLRQEVDDALALFGDKGAKGTVVLRPYAEYLEMYNEKVAQLCAEFPLGEEIIGEQAQKDFLTLFGSILRLRNILQAFDDFAGDDVLSLRDLQDYQSMYIDLYQQRRSREEADKEIINDDIVFEAELVKQIEVNIDYILQLVAQYHDGHMKDKTILADIDRTIMASPDLRSKKDLIDSFIESLASGADVQHNWKEYIARKKQEEFDRIISEEQLKASLAEQFIVDCFKEGYVDADGTGIVSLLPHTSRFSPGGDYGQKKSRVIARLQQYFDRFAGM